MTDSIFWGYLEELPEQEAAWREWNNRLANWHRFNTFYTHEVIAKVKIKNKEKIVIGV